MPSVPRTRSALELPLSPTRQERGNRSVLDNTNTCSTISFAHSFRGRRFLLRSLATGFSLAGTFALAKESSCPTPRCGPPRRSSRLLLNRKDPHPPPPRVDTHRYSSRVSRVSTARNAFGFCPTLAAYSAHLSSPDNRPCHVLVRPAFMSSE